MKDHPEPKPRYVYRLDITRYQWETGHLTAEGLWVPASIHATAAEAAIAATRLNGNEPEGEEC